MAVQIQGKMKPANNNKYFLMDAEDIEVSGQSLIYSIPIILTQAEYDILLNGGEVVINNETLTFDEKRIYMIIREV